LEYTYDPIEYHGPTLYYFSLIGSWISGVNKYEELDENIIRGIPVFFSLILFLALFSLRNILDKSTLIIGSLFLTISPYINFYSRFFIHEILFATFTILLLVSLYHFYLKRKNSSIIWAGIFAGLIFATKETSLIVFLSIFISIVSTKYFRVFTLKSLLLMIFVFVVVSIIFYSSFFANIKGIVDSVLTYKYYFLKSSMNTEHVQPWNYYIILLGYNSFDGRIISELAIIVLSFIGIIYSFKQRENKREQLLFRLVSIFTISYFIIFSSLAYKTPWNILTGWIGVILLSGYGFTNVYYSFKNYYVKIIVIIIVTAFSLNLGYQTYITSYVDFDNQNNPYTYSQPTDQIYELTNKVDKLINFKKDILINVIAEDNQYWPLPWYLRRATNISWNDSPKSDIHKFEIIIAEPKYVEQITNLLYKIPKPGEMDLYVPLLEKDSQIRPGKYFSSYIKSDLFEEYLSTNDN